MCDNGYLEKWSIIIFNSFIDLTLNWIDWDTCLEIEPRPTKFLICYNNDWPLLWIPKVKKGWTLHPSL